jgi:SAM-dependent methyltransferase
MRRLVLSRASFRACSLAPMRPSLEKLFAWTFRLNLIRRLLAWRGGLRFESSQAYWERRYAAGDTSGAGSHGSLASFKAGVINRLVIDRGMASVIEFGCGDGEQLSLASYPRYLGFDVSQTAIDKCRERFSGDPSKHFRLLKDYAGETAELVLSLDVIYHLVEDDVFAKHMSLLFGAAERMVIIYSTDSDSNSWFSGAHVRNRRFSTWVGENATTWKLTQTRPGFGAAFYVYEHIL